jgi:transcriptional regulator with XRE-family HTH domain
VSAPYAPIGDRLRRFREGLDVSQGLFARLLGISQQALSQLESGKNQPSRATIEMLDVRFGMRRQWLVDGEGEAFSWEWRENEHFIGQAIRTLRTSKNLERDELAADLETDIDEVRLVEQGLLHPTADYLERFYARLGLRRGEVRRIARELEREAETRRRS